jgi:excisionase family DNA binding protein
MEREEDALLTVKEVLGLLRVSRMTLYKAINSGDLRHVKIGKRTLFRRRDVERFIESKVVKK